MSIAWLLIPLCHGWGRASDALAYTPEDPTVRHMVERALPVLENSQEERLGGRCLVAMVFHKEGFDEDHPAIAHAVRQCQATCAQGPNSIREDVYSVGIAAIFLAELNPQKYAPEIKTLLSYLKIHQKDGGGWGYALDHPAYGRTGDTSMTQYAVLALWTTHRQGITFSDDMVVGVCNWLLRTQDPSGAWGYQGTEPERNGGQRVEQMEIRPSICAAGLGSTYICGELLGLKASTRRRRGEAREIRIEEELPSALELVTSDNSNKKSRRSLQARGRVDPDRWQRALSDGQRWFQKNYTIAPQRWPLYYLYALERYQSFRELAEGRSDPDHNWYDDGVEHLGRIQTQNGSWTGLGGPEVSTAFAVLFLTRSTQRAIQKAGYGEGRLTGGRGLPTNVANVQVKRGRIVSTPLGGSVADALAALEDPDHPDYDVVTDTGEGLQLSGDQRNRSRQLTRLRRIARAGSYKARTSAVRLLARQRNLNDVPMLILALSDPDPGVRREADQGLRFISRRLDGVGPSAESTGAQAQAARVEAWKQWYRSVRPNAEFLEPR